MVKELSVKQPEASKWDDPITFSDVMYEFAVEGVALPDDLAEYQREASGFGWFYHQKEALGPSAVKAAMEWDAWHLEQASKAEQSEP